MASHALAISKASFAASLLRPDPTPITREQVALFHTNLDALLQHCSTATIQPCKEWLLENVVPSAGRTAAFGKFLTTYSGSLVIDRDKNHKKISDSNGPPARRKQLHILYLIGDLFHHTKAHVSAPAPAPPFAESLQQSTLELVKLASAYKQDAFPRHHRNVQDLIEIWEKRQDLSRSQCQYLSEAVTRGTESDFTSKGEASKNPCSQSEIQGQDISDAPFMMPATHGDSATPFYDLPAGNMMPHIIPNSTTPIDPQSMKPLQFVPGPADAVLIAAVQGLLKSAESLDSMKVADIENGERDLDELGQTVLKDEFTGESLESEAYYGWSVGFCRKMKQTSPDTKNWDTDRIKAESPERNPSSRKRRRYSYSESDISRSNGSSMSGRSRSSSPDRRPGLSNPNDMARTSGFLQNPSATKIDHEGVSMPNPILAAAVPPPLPPPFTQGFPIGPGGVPIPPRPPHYNGPWPPPPPPPPPPPFPYANTGLPGHLQEKFPPNPPNLPVHGQSPVGSRAYYNSSGYQRS